MHFQYQKLYTCIKLKKVSMLKNKEKAKKERKNNKYCYKWHQVLRSMTTKSQSTLKVF